MFRSGAYDRSAQGTIGGFIWRLIERALIRVFETFHDSPPLRTIALWSAFGLLALIVVRFIYVAAQRDQLSARARAQHGRQAAAANPWLAAQRAAAEGQYTDAAHFLYAALLAALARRERLRLHPSKTAGDYVRELRRRSSPGFTPFRAFVRAFEFIIYGRGECDRAEFERLRALAEPLLGARE